MYVLAPAKRVAGDNLSTGSREWKIRVGLPYRRLGEEGDCGKESRRAPTDRSNYTFTYIYCSDARLARPNQIRKVNAALKKVAELVFQHKPVNCNKQEIIGH